MIGKIQNNLCFGSLRLSKKTGTQEATNELFNGDINSRNSYIKKLDEASGDKKLILHVGKTRDADATDVFCLTLIDDENRKRFSVKTCAQKIIPINADETVRNTLLSEFVNTCKGPFHANIIERCVRNGH